MTHTALKDFPLSRDGVHIEQVAAGNQVDVPDDICKGLTKEGFISAQAKNTEGSEGAGDGGKEIEQTRDGVQDGAEGTGEGPEGAGDNADTGDAKASGKKSAASKKDGAE